MNELEFSFEPDPVDAFLSGLKAGDRVAASRLLTLLEGEDTEALENVLQELETAGVTLEIDLPKTHGTGEAAVRLRQEELLAAEGLNPGLLEESDPLRLYLEELAGVPAFGDEAVLAAQCAEKAGGEEQLANLGLSRVIELAQDYVGYGVLLMDLIQEGSLGLWQAIQSYCEGVYADHRDRWIRFYLARAVILQAHASGVGQKMRRAMEDYRQIDERLLAELGRNPTLEEIAEQLHMSPEETEAVKKTIENARLVDRVNRPEEPEDSQEQTQAVEDTALFQMRQRIGDLLSGLEEADARLLTLRFGLEGGKPRTPEETGRLLGLTPQEVVAREAAALSKLRKG